MARWRPLIGRLLFLLAVLMTAYLGATLGWLGTREVRASHNFTDVPDSAFYHAFVQFLVDTGITSGCAPGLFCGEDPVTRGQMAVFLKKLSDLVGQNVAGQTATLQAQITVLQTAVGTMPCMRREGTEVIFEGCNVHIRAGAGATDAPVNGLGNLIVGYNEALPTQDRTGSHNLVVGRFHTYSSYGGLVAGEGNAVTGAGASVTGGVLNTARNFASVGGGFTNAASGFAASVSGGFTNTASGDQSSVSGGVGNTASGDKASVSGGQTNTASGDQSSVSGGWINAASGFGASVSGGQANTASGNFASVSGGLVNAAGKDHASVSGGRGNTASGDQSSVSGGIENRATGSAASVSGGNDNLASGVAASVSGGSDGSATGDFDWVAGSLFQDN